LEKEKTYTEKLTADSEIEKENSKRLDRFADYQKMRCESHGHNVPYPIVKDPKTGLLHWASRAQRRKKK